ncbi:MAG: 4Fe-4S binding protein [Methanolobus sp.]|nr:4Fe-4S binding protein [Methanolobus sp.]
MVAIVDKDLCTGCGACVDSCPVEAISMSAEDLAVVDPDTCVDCGDCVEICPVDAISLE